MAPALSKLKESTPWVIGISIALISLAGLVLYTIAMKDDLNSEEHGNQGMAVLVTAILCVHMDINVFDCCLCTVLLNP